MSSEPRWLGKKALLLLHEESLAEFGGARAPGRRSSGSPRRAPLNVHAYNEAPTLPSLPLLAATASPKTMPLWDGNKRAAFLSIGLFLTINGYRLTAPQLDAIETMLDLAVDTLTEPELALWISQNSKER